jgi:hypothetical protein
MSREEAREAMARGQITPAEYMKVIERTHDQYASRFDKVLKWASAIADRLEKEAELDQKGRGAGRGRRQRRPAEGA